MRKLLLATTGLVAAGVVASMPVSQANAQAEPATISPGGALDLTIKGFVRFKVEVAEDDFIDRGYGFTTDSEVHVDARNIADASGIEYGATVEFEADPSATVNVDENWLFFRGGFGEFRGGNEDGAADNMKVGSYSIAAGTGGLDGDLANLGPRVGPTNSGDATKAIYYSPTVAGFQLGVSFTPDSDADGSRDSLSEDDGGIENWIEAGLTWGGQFGGFDILAGAVGSFGSGEDAATPGAEAEDVTAWHVGAKTTVFGFNVGAHYGNNDDGDSEDYWGVGIGAALGMANVSAEYGQDDDVAFYVISADTGLMPGVALRGDVGYADADDEDVGDGFAGIVRIDVAF